MPDPLIHLQDRIGHTFRDPVRLQLALTHPSWLQDHPTAPDSNQRLEFLGDAVLQLVLTEAIFAQFPTAREGDLSKRRAALTNGPYLAALAREIELGAALRLSSSEHSSGGHDRDSTLEDAFEALLGAVFLDSDYATARAVIRRIFGDLPARLGHVIADANPKGQLQERIQPTLGNGALRYDVDHVSGQDHEREYEARVFLQDRLIGTGRGPSKKAAEEEAARQALDSPHLPGTTG